MMHHKLFLFILFFAGFFYSKAQFGQMLHTNDMQDYVLVADHSALDLFDDFTVECWIQADVMKDTIYIFRKGWCNGGDDSYYLAVINGKVRWHWNYSGNCNYSSFYETDSVVIHPLECTHITVVHSSINGISIYVNNQLMSGNLSGGFLSTVHNSANPMSIAAYRFYSGAYGGFSSGGIDEIRFWNYPLSQQDIINYSSHPLTGSEPGLILYFDMEDTGVGTNLTITNKATVSGNITGFGHGTSTTPEFTPSCISMGIENNPLDTRRLIYPNPAQNSISIQGDFSSYKIYTGNGILVKEGKKEQEIDVSDLPAAIYFIKICNEKDICRFVKWIKK